MLINPSVCCRDEYREYDRRCHIAGITSISIKDKDGKLVGDVKSDEELPYRVGYMDDGSAIMDKDGLSDKAVKQWYYPEYAKSNCTIVFSRWILPPAMSFHQVSVSECLAKCT